MKIQIVSAALAAALTATLAGAAVAQQPPPAVEQGLPMSALVNLPAKGGAKLTVTSDSYAPGADIPFENTQYRGNVFPGIKWTAGPAGTKSYALIMQDTDGVRNGAPILHWTMFNIPGTSLAKGMTAPPAGSSYGPNIRGANQAYMGPRTPAGPKHRYHVQIFALDTTLALDGATATYDQLTAAMKDHVLASGEVIGLGQVDPNAPPAPARGGGAAPAAPAAAPK